MKYQKKYLWIFIILLINCCSIGLLLPDNNDAERAKKKWKDSDLNQLKSGYNIYKNNCASCHGMYKPESFEAKHWKKILPRMKTKTKLDSIEYSNLYRYVITMSKTENK